MRKWLRTKVRKRAIVYTVDEQTLDGWLVEVAGDGLVLNDTHVRTERDVPLPGDVFVPAERVRFVQIVRSSTRGTD